MKKFCLYTVWVMSSTSQLYADTPTDASGVGIDRFEKNGWYMITCKQRYNEGRDEKFLDANHVGHPAHLSASAGTRTHSYCQWRIENISQDRPPTKRPVCLTSIRQPPTRPALFIDDICQSQLDQDLFHTHLAEGNFHLAYFMATNNKQGNLWKRQAVAQAKNKLAVLAKQSVYPGDPEAQASLTLAKTIVSNFRDTPFHAELNSIFEQAYESAQARYENILANPQVAILHKSMQQELGHLLFDNH